MQHLGLISMKGKWGKWSRTEAVTWYSKINEQKMMIMEWCRCYLFLCDKLPSNLAAKNKYVLSHCLYGSGIWAWLHWVPLPQSLSQGCAVQGYSVLWGLDWRGICWDYSWLLAGLVLGSSLTIGWDLPQFPATWVSPLGSGQHDSLLWPSK